MDDGLVFEYTDPESGTTFAVHHEESDWWVGFPFESTGQLRIPHDEVHRLVQLMVNEFGTGWGRRSDNV